jgi:hypothetical protein
MPNDTYHSRKPWISRSQAHRCRGVYGGRSQRYSEVKGKPVFAGNSATGFGSLVDGAFEAVVSGVDWRSRVVVPPAAVLASDGSRRGKPFQEWRSSLPAGSVECTATDYEKVSEIIESLWEHKAARRLMEAVTHSQYSVFWTDGNGHQRKARADGVTPTGWFDLKTTSGEWWEMRRSFERFGYDWQHAWYLDGAIAAGFEPFLFKFIVVQTFAPYDVWVGSLDDDSVARARSEIDATLDAMRRRRESGEYLDEAYHEEKVLVLG